MKTFLSQRHLPHHIIRPNLAASLLACILVSCSTQHQSHYHGTDSNLPEEVVKQKQGEVRLGAISVIEFDERGDYWDAAQVTRADKMIRDKSAPILVTYVHGWRHDARRDDTDLVAFRKFIRTLQDGVKQPVCGVFIGWRGASVQEKGIGSIFSQPAALLSFWGRKKITDQMAGVPFNNTLWRLAATAGDRHGHSILIGHSFGGRIVERTLGPAAVAQMHNNKAMPYNLTFLINPATESLYARQLKLALRKWGKDSQPAIVVLAAKNDSATGGAWPLALRINRGTRDREYAFPVGDNKDFKESQKSYVTSTVGNDQRQWTHHVLRAPDKGTAPQKATMNEDQVITANLKNASRDRSFWVRLRGEPENTATRCWVQELSVTDAAHQIGSNAYWVIPLDKDILSGHGGIASENGIFNNAMGDLMAGIIGATGAVKQDASRVPLSPRDHSNKTTAPAGGITLPRIVTPF